MSAPALVTPADATQVALLVGGDALFPDLKAALATAREEVLLATYIFNDDPCAESVAQALAETAARGVAVRVLVDGFGSSATLATLRAWLAGSAVQLEVFRPLDHWWAWLQPGQLRRLHHKLCAIDGRTAFVGGINVIDDRFDLHHGWSQMPRLDFAVRVEGPLAAEVHQVTRALWTRANLGRDWRGELTELARSGDALDRTRQLLRDLRSGQRGRGDVVLSTPGGPGPRASLVVRDNFGRRRAIERAYIEAIGRARVRIDIACPYFYPRRAFRRALRRAARRGVQVRLLLQGKIDYRIAAVAARVQYDELLAWGIAIYEYTPAFLHAKVAVVDRQWSTVGSSNIDPLSLLLNHEANVVVQDEAFVAELSTHLDEAFARATPILAPVLRPGLRGWLSRTVLAWMAALYLRLAGMAGRY